MRHSGVLVQLDAEEAKRPPVERLRAAVAECEAKRGWKPALVLVNMNGYEWPAEIDGVAIEPSPSIAYPAWMLLVA